MKTASQIIRALIFSPDLCLDSLEQETIVAKTNALNFLAMEQEVHASRALVRLNQFDEARKKLDELIQKHGITEAVLATEQFMGRVREAHRTLKLEALLKEALELASQDDDDFYRDNRGPNRVMEIAKEAANL